MLSCASPLQCHLVLLFRSALPGLDLSSVQYTAIFSAGETTAQVAVKGFDDNVKEGSENFTAALNISEFSQFLGVGVNQNASKAIIYIEDNFEIAAILAVSFEGVTTQMKL